MKRAALLARLAVVGLIAGAAGLAYFAYTPVGDSAPHPFNHDRNAVWLEHRWLERPHPEVEMEALFSRLRSRGIAYAYPHVIPFDAQGRLPRHDREQMRAFLATARRVAPDLRVLPWIGGLRKGYKRQRPGTVQLGDLTQRQRMVAEARGLVDEGFDGVHLNVEPVDDGNDEYLALLRALRTAVGPGHLLSVSAIRPAPVGLPAGPQLRLEPRLLRPGGRDRGPDRDHGLRHRAADSVALPAVRSLGGPVGGRRARRVRLRGPCPDGGADL